MRQQCVCVLGLGEVQKRKKDAGDITILSFLIQSGGCLQGERKEKEVFKRGTILWRCVNHFSIRHSALTTLLEADHPHSLDRRKAILLSEGPPKGFPGDALPRDAQAEAKGRGETPGRTPLPPTPPAPPRALQRPDSSWTPTSSALPRAPIPPAPWSLWHRHGLLLRPYFSCTLNPSAPRPFLHCHGPSWDPTPPAPPWILCIPSPPAPIPHYAPTAPAPP
ncbi:PREDICTED: vegetative cell wall protein gp1-like [Rhinopithecus bieti]|uniref:vegetative cell wall protein gp1-like n=1 Tax=Rhinopithecus bieti TaxID=61621 RepID=UPI00083BB28B|nr:PREDICTED: vegetative cell wall protein gp1-like [Rhinopithecus bieti]